MLGEDTAVTIQIGFLITIIFGVAWIIIKMRKVDELDKTINSESKGLVSRLTDHENRISSLEDFRVRIGKEVQDNSTNIGLNTRMIQKSEQSIVELITKIEAVQRTLGELKNETHENFIYLRDKIDSVEKKPKQ